MIGFLRNVEVGLMDSHGTAYKTARVGVAITLLGM
jgi:hypothetical protein